MARKKAGDPPAKTPAPAVRSARPSALVDTTDALREIDRFFKKELAVIIPLTVREILNEQNARKFA